MECRRSRNVEAARHLPSSLKLQKEVDAECFVEFGHDRGGKPADVGRMALCGAVT